MKTRGARNQYAHTPLSRLAREPLISTASEWLYREVLRLAELIMQRRQTEVRQSPPKSYMDTCRLCFEKSSALHTGFSGSQTLARSTSGRDYREN